MSHTITLSAELYEHLQQLKLMIKEITNQEITSDEDAISLLIGGFFDSIEHAHAEHGHHGHHHHHHGEEGCGSDGCACKH
jgi:hypothetical protein